MNLGVQAAFVVAIWAAGLWLAYASYRAGYAKGWNDRALGRWNGGRVEAVEDHGAEVERGGQGD